MNANTIKIYPKYLRIFADLAKYINMKQVAINKYPARAVLLPGINKIVISMIIVRISLKKPLIKNSERMEINAIVRPNEFPPYLLSIL
jgi:hypothetical protein